MTNEGLKLECYKLSRGYSGGFDSAAPESRLKEAKDLYEWVTEKEDSTQLTEEDREFLNESIDDFFKAIKDHKEQSSCEGEIEHGLSLKDFEGGHLEEEEVRVEGNSINVITKKDTVEFNYKGEDIIVCRSWEHIPEDRGGKTVFWVTRVFEDEGITTKIKFI